MFGLIIAAVVYPWRSVVDIPAVMAATEQRRIFAETPAQILEIRARRGQEVAPDDVLFVLTNPDLAYQASLAERRIELLELRLGRRVADAEDRAESAILARQLEEERQNLANFRASEARLQLRAGVAGRVVELTPHLAPGQWVAGTALLALIAAPETVEIRGYVGEDDRVRLSAGASGVFVPDDPALPTAEVQLSEIGEFGVASIDIPYLASTNGGPIEIDPEETETLKPADARFAVTADPHALDATDGKAVRGLLKVEGVKESIAARAARQVMRVLIREAGV